MRFFPFIFYLHIFQLEEYKVFRFLKWLSRNLFKRNVEQKKKLAWTSKAKQIFLLALAYAVIQAVLLTYFFKIAGVFLGVLIATQSYLFIILGHLTRRPYELWNRQRVICTYREKILALKKRGLRVIGITGSYGKTSVKEHLYQILRTKYTVLRTPESYNTLFGIRDVIALELDETYDFFICEMGAYTIGEIAELCQMVPPDFSCVTAINEQHIERFGSLENTTTAKFEIIAALEDASQGLVNIDNERIKNKITEEKYKCLHTYSLLGDFAEFKAEIKNISGSGTEFNLILSSDATRFNATTQLTGRGNIQNILAACSLSYLVGMSPEEIAQGIEKIKPLAHRLELKQLSKENLLLDDAYSSNVDGFKQALEVLKGFQKVKIIATPGIVELGDKTEEIHAQLGPKIEESCDLIYLIGSNIRTNSIAKAINTKERVIFVSNLGRFIRILPKRKLRVMCC
jgi:UDP-N-acetylmuramoyl-tripeptide--D-alanyl-D-alanine ligase